MLSTQVQHNLHVLLVYNKENPRFLFANPLCYSALALDKHLIIRLLTA